MRSNEVIQGKRTILDGNREGMSPRNGCHQTEFLSWTMRCGGCHTLVRTEHGAARARVNI